MAAGAADHCRIEKRARSILQITKLSPRTRLQVLETASTSAGALAVAAILTSTLQTTVEDVFALALAGGLAYVSFLTWPLKRADIKGAIAKKYEDMADKLTGAQSFAAYFASSGATQRVVVACVLASTCQARWCARAPHLRVFGDCMSWCVMPARCLCCSALTQDLCGRTCLCIDA